ncbi:MAG: nuclear transport factor 2 family protein [Chlamydiales bacterium]
MTAINKNLLAREQEAVKKALKGFYQAVEQMVEGNPEPLYSVWSHSEDAINMGPFDQCIKGWSAIRQEINRLSKMKMGGGQPFKRSEPELIIGNELAVSYGFLTGKVKDPQGKLHPIKHRESIVFSKEGEEWKIIGLHIDRFPFEG